MRCLFLVVLVGSRLVWPRLGRLRDVSFFVFVFGPARCGVFSVGKGIVL